MLEQIILGISSEVHNLNYIDDVFEAIALLYNIPEDELYDIILLAREAAVNSIKHAYKEEPGLIDISIDLIINNESYIDILVTDYGKGFDPAKIPDPLEQDNLLKSSGRGILLIRNLSDNHEIKSDKGKGTSIKFRKYFKKHKGEDDA